MQVEGEGSQHGVVLRGRRATMGPAPVRWPATSDCASSHRVDAQHLSRLVSTPDNLLFCNLDEKETTCYSVNSVTVCYLSIVFVDLGLRLFCINYSDRIHYLLLSSPFLSPQPPPFPSASYFSPPPPSSYCCCLVLLVMVVLLVLCIII